MMKSMSKATRGGLVVLGAALLALAGGCEFVLGTSPDPRIVGEGGGGTGGASSSSSSGAMVCAPGATLACYSGAEGTEDVGVCKGGAAICRADGSGFGGCAGQVTPVDETCGSTDDEDCDGKDCVQWAGLFGNLEAQRAMGVAVDSAGNSYTSGAFLGAIPLPGGTLMGSSSGYGDAFLIKLDPVGVPLWGKATPEASGSYVKAVAVDAQGHVVVAGLLGAAAEFAGLPAGPGMFVAKLAADGQALWTQTLGGNWLDDSFASVAFTATGDIVVAGSFGSDINFGDGLVQGPTAIGSSFGFLARLRGSDGSGKAADGGWIKVLCSGSSHCPVSAAQVDGNDSVLMAGNFKGMMSVGGTGSLTAQGTYDGYLGKLAADGAPVWQRQLGGAGASVDVLNVAVDAAGSATVVGTFKGSVDIGAGTVAAPTAGAGFVAHYGGDKAYKWSKVLTNGTAEAVSADASGNVFLAGNYSGSFDLGGGPITAPGAGGTFVGKLSGAGVFQWARGYDAGKPKAIACTAAGDPVVVGSTDKTVNFGTGPLMPAGGEDIFIAKLSR